jgi:hypothetical protein
MFRSFALLALPRSVGCAESVSILEDNSAEHYRPMLITS